MKQFLRGAALALVGLFLTASVLQAQFTAQGKVSDTKGDPIIGATVTIKGTGLGAITGVDGAFAIEVPRESATLVVSFIGYSRIEQEVSSSSGDLNIVMSELETTLDEVVVTGLATTVKRANLANSVAQINSEKLTGITTQQTMDAALYGKFKGAEIRSNSGAPGGGMSVKLRGVSSIFGDQQPLYIIDGIFIDNSTISLGTNIVSAAAGGGNTATNQDDASNRIADIDPEDIETIEILKGASAAAIYGSRAAGGVVIITTKRGRAGRTRVKLSQSLSFITPIRLLGTRDWTEQKIQDNFSAADVDKFRANGITDYEAELYDHTRLGSTTRLDVSGGNAKTNFFIGSTFKSEDGLVDNTGYEKASLRVNVSHKFTDWLSLDVSNNYINSTSDRGFFNNGNTNTTVGYALAFTRPWEDLFPDENGNYPANPAVGSNVLETVARITNREKINRYIGGGTLNVRILQNEKNNLKLVLTGGLDQYTLRTTGIFPRDLTFYQDPSSLGGVSISGTTVNSNYNLSAVLVHSYYLSSGLSFRTQLGVLEQNFDQNTVITTAAGLNGSQTNVDQATSVSAFQNRETQQDKGFFVQEEINYNDQIIATLGLRGDKSSNNGDPNQLFYYPKASLAINIHNFDFWTVEPISSFKLRSAYGESARFPGFADRFNVLTGTLIGGNSGVQTVNLLGNPDVRPERQSELEIGTDIGLLEDRITVDFSYYIKNIDDLLLRAQLPTSSGFTRQVVNAGALQNKGFEIGLNANIVKSNDLNWDFGVNFWKNQSLVTRLDIPAFNLGGFAASLGQYRIQEGQSATQIVGTIDPADCETGDCSDLDPDGDGFRVYGNAEPDFNMSFINSLNFGDLEFSFLVHWKQGGEGVNLSTLLWDLAGLTWDFDDLTLDPDGQTGNGPYRLNSWFAGDTGPWVEDAGYVRLREIGIFYNIGADALGDNASVKVGVSGRNLLNFFSYNSYDPEVSNFGGNVLANSIEVTPFPSTKRANVHVGLTF